MYILIAQFANFPTFLSRIAYIVLLAVALVIKATLKKLLID